MYFVVEKDQVIALDISEALREYRENVVVHVFETLQKARTGALSLGRPETSVVSLSSLEEADAHEIAAIGEMSQNVVLIVDNAESVTALPQNCIIVARPFGSSALAAALIKLAADRG